MHENDIGVWALSDNLYTEFKRLGLERTFGSLTLDELKQLTEDIKKHILKNDAAQSEPPF
jgi:hypothetical protein